MKSATSFTFSTGLSLTLSACAELDKNPKVSPMAFSRFPCPQFSAFSIKALQRAP
jgi:hypothetical protein